MCLEGPWKTAGSFTNYRIEEAETRCYLIFEGSVEDEDWVANFLFPPALVRPYKDCTWLCHGGFSRRWKAAREQIIAEVLETGKPVVVVGYSHGAGIALLAFEDLRFMGISTTGYGFGGPRILWLPNRRLRKRLEGFTIMLNRGDIVGHVAPWLWGYRHPEVKRIGNPSWPGVKQHMQDSYIQSLTE